MLTCSRNTDRPDVVWSDAARSESGATMLEGTLVFAFMIVFLTVTCEIARLCFTQLTMQYVLTKTAREIAVADSPRPRDVMTELQSRFDSFGFAFRPTQDLQGNALNGSYEVTVCPFDELDTASCAAGTIKLGNGPTSLVYRLRRSVGGFAGGNEFQQLGFRNYQLTSILISKNEPRQ